MSEQYDKYLVEHEDNVERGWQWLRSHFPDMVKKMEGNEYRLASHDSSKFMPDEYVAYDKYFYGGNKSYQVVQDFNKAWLLHIHRNPHHWQYWALVQDYGPEILIEMPYWYIVEMICDWWSFSWKSENLYEIFDWYEKNKDHMKLNPKTRKTVEDILKRMREELDRENNNHLEHHGVKGQKWGVLNGPPYPIGSHLKNRTPAHVEKLENYKGKLYWVSEEDMDGKQLTPRVPENFFTKNDYEDNTTKRLCFAPEVDKCLIALSQNLDGKKFNVYEPSEMPKDIFKPNKGAVPDAEVTGELWVTEPVTLKKTGEITVTGDDGKDGMRFEYGDGREAELYGWNYKWNKKPSSSQDLSDKLYSEAEKREPAISKDVQESAEKVGSKMYGLEHRLKTKDSIHRKINVDSEEKEISIDDAASDIKDAVRYTTISSGDKFVGNYIGFKEMLENKGYKEVRCKNYFDLYNQGKVKHKSVQSVFETPDGYKFEVQFQTPESQEAKDKKVPIYEERRKAGLSRERQIELEKQMEELAEKVPEPKDIQKIKTH